MTSRPIFHVLTFHFPFFPFFHLSIVRIHFSQVPGAGGVDAIFALTLGPHARSAVEGLWAAWSKRTVCPLMLTAQGASDPSPGIRAETFLGWD